MKILYAIQGTGNGHITIARDLVPRLQKYATVDVLISGMQVEISLPFPVKYKLNGLGFVFGKSGGIDYLETYKKNKLRNFYEEIKQLPVQNYDLVISDFEPISSWACYFKKVNCIGISHQAAVLNKKSPRPSNNDIIGEAVLKYYAPTNHSIGFHFLAYDKNLYTPLIREEVRTLDVSESNNYVVYLPAYSDKKIIQFLRQFEQENWIVFSKHTKESYKSKNITIKKIENESFLKNLATCKGIICGAGFQTPSEALFLHKKLLVIPMKGQFEQQCNAEALRLIGIPIIKSLKEKHFSTVKEWLQDDKIIGFDYPDIANSIIDQILKLANRRQLKPNALPSKFKEFRSLILSKIFDVD